MLRTEIRKVYFILKIVKLESPKIYYLITFSLRREIFRFIREQNQV